MASIYKKIYIQFADKIGMKVVTITKEMIDRVSKRTWSQVLL